MIPLSIMSCMTGVHDFLDVIMSRLRAWRCLPSVKMPSASADSPYLDFDYFPSQSLGVVVQKCKYKYKWKALSTTPLFREFIQTGASLAHRHEELV